MEALRFQASFTQLEFSVYRAPTRRFHLYPARCAASFVLTPRAAYLRRFVSSCSAHSHAHGHDHDHGHDHSHAHRHHHHGDDESDKQLTKPQEVLLKFADAIRWSHLANFLREHLELCCTSAALFIAAAACPYVLPKPAVKPLQRAFAVIAFPLVGVSLFHHS